MALNRRIFPTRFGQLHLRSVDGKDVPLVELLNRHLPPWVYAQSWT
ncbi:MAG TPA: hypothetical protein VNR70_06615 [Steroidobacteraceae bacterium]|jgi:hypothetical protein|nr:hypothetical protein [Steroidobacteraceae bacterium]